MAWLRRVVLAAAMVLGLGAPAFAAPALWVVKDADSEIYLFGTLHALDPALHWRTPAYNAALARAGTVWFEADLDSADPRTIGEIVARYGVDRERPLSDKLAAPDLEALRGQVDLARIDHLRPWAAALMLSMQPMLERGARIEAGADLTVTRVARREAKRVRTFESLEDQARMFAGLSEPTELRYLADIIQERAGNRRAPPAPGRSLERAWAAGDLARLGDELAGDLRDGNPGLYDALLKQRNLRWADTLAAQMDGAGVELVNVGALHMVGEDGLPALLAARGYSVERVQ
ncbi:TraB/GumN family protein [Phenylobacterium sp.]|uniref:TraB/GumN family protein n=1 Tax=Phenylobacterium sp. TaxID=1871053 RepID=UPI0037851BCA